MMTKLDLERPALICESHVVTYAEWAQRVKRRRETLRENGIVEKKVLLDLPDSFTLLEWIYANWECRNTLLVFDRQLTRGEKDERTALFRPDVLIRCSDDSVSQLASFYPEVEVEIEEIEIPNVEERERFNERQPAFYLLTSGSTALPKVIRRSLESIRQELDSYALEPGTPGENSRCLCLVPLSHSFGLISCVMNALARGACVVFSPLIKAATIVQTMIDNEVSHVFGVAFHYQLIANALVRSKPEWKRVPKFLCSGGPLPQMLATQYEQQLGVALGQQYGMSEVGYIAVDWNSERPGSVGKIAQYLRASVDEDGQLIVALPRSPYALGQLQWRRGEGISGWLLTQDQVEVDEQGYLSIRGRLNEQISVGGMKVDLREIEAAIKQFAEIQDCCVIHYELRPSHPTIEAVVVVKEGREFHPSNLKLQLAQQLAAYKIPHVISQRESIPVSKAGKILKGVLIQERLKSEQTTH